MTQAVDLARLAAAPRTTLTISVYRNIAPKYDPRSGEGARLHGGRFNPPGSFPTLYLCETRDCAIAELSRQGTRNVVGVEGLLPRALYRYDFELTRVLDLTDERVLEALGVDPAHLVTDDWSYCQQLGAAAHDSDDQAIRSPSATGVDTIVAVFVELIGGSLLDVDLVAEWTQVSDL